MTRKSGPLSIELWFLVCVCMCVCVCVYVCAYVWVRKLVIAVLPKTKFYRYHSPLLPPLGFQNNSVHALLTLSPRRKQRWRSPTQSVKAAMVVVMTTGCLVVGGVSRTTPCNRLGRWWSFLPPDYSQPLTNSPLYSPSIFLTSSIDLPTDILYQDNSFFKYTFTLCTILLLLYPQLKFQDKTQSVGRYTVTVSLAGRYVGMLGTEKRGLCPHRKYRKILCVSFAINSVQECCWGYWLVRIPCVYPSENKHVTIVLGL